MSTSVHRIYYKMEEKCVLRRVKPDFSFVHFLFYKKSLASAALVVITSSSCKMCHCNILWKIYLLVPFRKFFPVHQASMVHQPFWEWGMLPALCHDERNYFYSVTAEETILSGDRLCSLPSPTLSYWRVQKPFCRHTDVSLMERRAGSFLEFSAIIYLFDAGLVKSWINPDCRAYSFCYYFSSQNVFDAQKLQEEANEMWHNYQQWQCQHCLGFSWTIHPQY